MSLYRYVKAEPAKARIKRKKPFIFSLSLMLLGVGILLWVAWPILSFSAISEQMLSGVVAPVDDSPILSGSPLASVAYAASPAERIVTDSVSDFSNANAWYPTAPQKHALSTTVTTYTLSIPKLKISKALATIAGDDLNSSLVHYGGTGLPGQYGSAVVFGHSTLPQFYSPTNYRTMFSTLPTLRKGDEIIVDFDGIEYRYEIYDMVVLDPTDLSVLEQKFDNSYLTLVTCVPPGTYWKRLNVHAKLKTF